VDIERETLQRLLEEREQVTSELSRGGYTWQVIEEPAAGIPFGPNPLKKIVLAIVVGLFLGGLLAFVREAMDTVVRTSEDLKKKVPLPLLGILPMPIARRGFNLLPTWRESTQSSQVHPELAESSLIQPILNPMFRESMDVIGNLLQLRQTQNVCKALTVTSGLPEEGKTTVILGLAYSLARMSQQVLIIDADLRRSGLRSELGLANGQNLSTFLIDGIEPTVFQKLDLGPVQIDILPAGPIPSDPLLLLSSPRFKRLVFRCRELYDVVLIDTPPVLGMADATKVGAVCDGIVLVTRLDRITQAELSEVVALLTPFNVLGLIANGGKSPSLRYGDYSDRSYASSRTTI
jgi:succinoglycan biosynthesis transport protein ExoP